jgi:hypothetical protein
MSGFLRVTAYWYASHHGLPCDLDSLLALGLAAARHGRWLGIPPWYVQEGPLRVHTWPETVFAYVTGAGCPGCGWRLPPGARLCESCDDAWGGLPPVSYAAWLEEGRAPDPRQQGLLAPLSPEEDRILAGAYGPDEAIPWDGDDFRPG